MQVIAGRFDPDEQHIPFDMFTGSCGASAREGLIEEYEIGHLINLRQEPVGKSATTAAGNFASSATGRNR